MISSRFIQGAATAAPVLDTVFKGKHVTVSWGVRGPELRKAAEPAATKAARRALSAVSGHAGEPRLHEVFVANQIAVAISIHTQLSNAAAGDAVFFLCDSQDVVEWLLSALAIVPD
ncbi:hypothetical protein [Stenotrophomonas sp. 24(2023)]|uniref:hypothetical protein n=1 Tax=Stenotrophomonas sp. 24(2023) TaxID=3068324 RepID=UPI0027E21151|nr:hypothetical protein [Stenotrophomonas sp. 24(2023)]WMJ69907.1 hypothetical protein Q9R17_02020 [Stenotrophomonas sp. 24(2023)]